MQINIIALLQFSQSSRSTNRRKKRL